MNHIPENCIMNAEGHFVPLNIVKPIDLERDRLVKEQAEKARALSAALAEFKAVAMADIGSFIEVSAQQYGVQLGGTKGNVTLLSYDGRLKIQRAIAEHLTFDERLQVAKALIDRCIHRWAEGSGDEIRALVEHAFQVDKEGKVSTSRILGLRKLNITDPDWKKAMDAISDSIQVSGSKSYIRFYERVGDADVWRPISLDVAGV